MATHLAVLSKFACDSLRLCGCDSESDLLAQYVLFLSKLHVVARNNDRKWKQLLTRTTELNKDK